MATQLSELAIVVRAKADQISSDIEKGIRRASGNFAAQGRVIGTALATGIAAGMATVAAAFRNGVKQVDDIAAAAQKAGTSFNWLSEMQLAAKLTDSSFEGLNASLVKMSANIATGKAAEALGKLKLDAAEIRKLQPEAQFERIAAELRKINDHGAKLGLGIAIFGKGFKDILPLVQATEAEMQQIQRIANVVGLTLSKEMVASIGEFDNATHVMVDTWNGFSRQLAGQVAPLMTNLSKMIVDQLESWGGMAQIVHNVVQKIQLVGHAIAFAMAKAQEMRMAINTWANEGIASALSGVAALTRALSGMVSTTVDGFRGMTNQFISGINATINATQMARTGLPKFMGGIDSFTPSTIPGLPGGAGDASAELFEQAAAAIDKTAESTRKLSQENMDAQVGARLTADEVLKAWEDQSQVAQSLINKTGATSQQTIKNIVDVSNKGAKEMQVRRATLVKDTNNAFSQMQDANRAMVTDMVSAWITGTGKMSDIINQWANQSLKRIIDVLLFGTRGGAGGAGGFGGVMGAVGGMGGGWGGAIASVAGALFGGARAEGGPVAAGRSYVVGERGPEMFMPKQSGNIMPNGIRGGGGTIFAPIINQTFAPGVSRVELAVIADHDLESRPLQMASGVRPRARHARGQ